jgi:hypothetical protein
MTLYHFFNDFLEGTTITLDLAPDLVRTLHLCDPKQIVQPHCLLFIVPLHYELVELVPKLLISNPLLPLRIGSLSRCCLVKVELRGGLRVLADRVVVTKPVGLLEGRRLDAGDEFFSGLVASQFFGEIKLQFADHFAFLPPPYRPPSTRLRDLLNFADLRQQVTTGSGEEGGRTEELVSLSEQGSRAMAKELAPELLVEGAAESLRREPAGPALFGHKFIYNARIYVHPIQVTNHQPKPITS